MDFQVRNLQTKDLYALVRILGKCGKDALIQISATLAAAKVETKENEEDPADVSVAKDDKDKSNISVGLTIISTLLLYAESDIKPFFASLVDKTTEEFDKLPFDATLAIIEELGKKEDLPNFFKRAMSLTKIFSTKK